MTPKALLHLLENQKGKIILCSPLVSPSASQKSYFLLPVQSSWRTRQPTASISASQSIQSCLGPSSFHLPDSLSLDSVFYSHFPHNPARKWSLLLTTYTSKLVLIMYATPCLLNCLDVNLGHKRPIEIPINEIFPK